MTSPAGSGAQDLNDLDKQLLNEVQWDFPLVERPYAALGDRLGIGEDEVITRLGAAKEQRVLRQLSAIFDTRALGYSSSLVAAKVGDDRIDEAAEVLNAHPGISHNYKRNHPYNLWYTLAVPPGDEIADHADALHTLGGCDETRLLPTLKLFKIGVKLDMTGQQGASDKDPDGRGPGAERVAGARDGARASDVATAAVDLEPISAEQMRAVRVLQEDLPLVSEPFAPGAAEAELTTEELLGHARRFIAEGRMRRFAAVMNHRNAGFKANVMVVWAVPEGEVDEAGRQMAGFTSVSHCYRRPTYDDWPFSVFTMIHGRTAADCEEAVAAIEDETGIREHALLWSVKEYKKVRVRYFTPEWDDWAGAHLAASG